MSFAFDKFDSIPNLRLINNARLIDKFIRLSSSSPNQIGAVWTSHLVPVANGFETTFKFRITDGRNPDHLEEHFPGADGLAFVIQNASSFALGNFSGSIGYDGIPNSLEIEFDTYANDSTQIQNFNDPNNNLIAILSNGIGKNSSKHLPPYIRRQTTNILPIRTDGTIYYAKIVYSKDERKFTIWMDTTENLVNPVLEVNGIDFSELLNLDEWEGVYIGFTSATGNSFENQDILAWTFCTKSWKLYSSLQETEHLSNNSKNLFFSP
ncbi:MAG: L-type lectin-domain containing protein [Candidatus Kapaibacteriota bacterium]